jgi:redox-sensing transcriptional repressor
MKKPNAISKATIDRLPLYFRTLRLLQDEGRDIISSDELGRRLGITPEQIRKDLASFGQFGKKGVGYYVNELKRNIGGILGLDNHWNIAIVGIGHLGVALANYQNFVTLGFNLVALLDQDPNVIGRTVNHVKVEDVRHRQGAQHPDRHHRGAGCLCAGRGRPARRGRRQGHLELRADQDEGS